VGDRAQRVKGAAKVAAGKTEREAGKATGRPSTRARGAAKEAHGKAEKAIGKMRSGAKKATR
jgi:uncharacterized protein YjbJ (UPF0337 family)